MESEAGQIFRDRYFQRFGREPSFAAAQAYNSVHLLVAALDESEFKESTQHLQHIQAG
jgi:ABC-type branched-subunit amino acid transport system substrate-binding protein